MKVVYPVRVFIASMTMIFLILVPRVLMYFNLQLGSLEALVSPWGTFSIILICGGIIMLPWLKKVKFAVPLTVLLIVASALLTIYFCKLPVSW